MSCQDNKNHHYIVPHALQWSLKNHNPTKTCFQSNPSCRLPPLKQKTMPSRLSSPAPSQSQPSLTSAQNNHRIWTEAQNDDIYRNNNSMKLATSQIFGREWHSYGPWYGQLAEDCNAHLFHLFVQERNVATSSGHSSWVLTLSAYAHKNFTIFIYNWMT